MGFSPAIGRFIERDPIDYIAEQQNDALGMNSRSADLDSITTLITSAINTAYDDVANQLGESLADSNPQLLEYADGSNFYAFVRLNPVSGSDPSGLDRYGNAGLHQWLAVHTWKLNSKNGCVCWEKTGTERYDFRFQWDQASAGELLLFGVGAMPFGGTGRVDPGPMQKSTSWNITSTPYADIALKTALDMQVANPPIYSLWWRNCIEWVNRNAYVGIAETANMKTIPICK